MKLGKNSDYIDSSEMFDKPVWISVERMSGLEKSYYVFFEAFAKILS